MDELTITTHQSMDSHLIERCYAMYYAAFEPLRTKAAARHLLTAEEFDTEATDERIDKLVAWRGDDLVGLATLTTDLTAIAWIEPQMYLRRWPDTALFYLGYALADPRHNGARVFTTLIDTALQRVADVGGTICWDACVYNAKRAVARINERVAHHWGGNLEVVDTHRYFGVSFDAATNQPCQEVLDTQTYYVAHFDHLVPPRA